MPSTPVLSSVFNCPVELALELIGGKWKPVILAHLKQGPKRYGELRRLTPKLSDKMLSQRLRELVELGLVDHDGPHYALSRRGESLRPVLDALYRWGLEIAAEIGACVEAPAASRASS